MVEILIAIGLSCVIGFCLFLYLKWREEAKREGYISDDYTDNNDESEEKENGKDN